MVSLDESLSNLTSALMEMPGCVFEVSCDENLEEIQRGGSLPNVPHSLAISIALREPAPSELRTGKGSSSSLRSSMMKTCQINRQLQKLASSRKYFSTLALYKQSLLNILFGRGN